MKRHELLAETITPDGMRMTLSSHAGNYYIEVENQALMSTRAPGSERALGALAGRELHGHKRPRVMIGGLGLGFTLASALEALPSGAEIVVVEYFEIIVDWNRKFAFQAGEDLLADPRVHVEVCDVVDYLRSVKRPFDAILLDVDNGPDAWTMESNDRLYDKTGLKRIRSALNPGGLLAVWSAMASPRFEKRMAQAGYQVESESVRSRDRKGERHTIFIGRI